MNTHEPYDLLPEFAAVADDFSWDNCTFEEQTDALATIDFDIRCDQLLRLHRNLDARKAALVAEMDRLKAKLNAIENRRESVRNYLRGVMVAMGTRKVKTTIATASISAGRESIKLADDPPWGLWPHDVIKSAVISQPVKIDKAALKNLPPDVLANLLGVSVECGEDVLTIR